MSTGPGSTTGPGGSSDDRNFIGTTYGSYRVTGVLGKGGMERVIEVELTDDERAALKASADAVLEPMQLVK